MSNPGVPIGTWADVRPEIGMGHGAKRRLDAFVGRTTQAQRTSNDLAFAATQEREAPW